MPLDFSVSLGFGRDSLRMERMADLYVADVRWMMMGGGGALGEEGCLLVLNALVMMLAMLGVVDILPQAFAA
jgi:hypothetical protein